MSQEYHCRIYVTLRPSVLDPAGVAVQSGLHQLGYEGVEKVRMGKYIELTMIADDKPHVETQLHEMCDRLLANPVIENYFYEITALANRREAQRHR